MIDFNFSNSVFTEADKSLQDLKPFRDQLLKRSDLGFFQTPQRADLWKTSSDHGVTIKESGDELVIVGIGGSALGAKALRGFFADNPNSSRLHVWDSLDAWVLEHAWNQLKNPLKTRFILISKSGSTLETFATGQWINDKLIRLGSSLEKQSLVITEKRSNTLYEWASKHSLPILEVPLDVGGRFTVLTPVGLVAASFLGLNLDQLKQGALQALEDENFVLKLSKESLASFRRGEWITLLWYYSDFLMDLGRWTQQLWAESLAKKENRKGEPAPRVSTPVVALGPADQHSLLQQIMEGARDKWVWIVEFPRQESSPFESDTFNSAYNLKGLDLDTIHKIQSQSIRQALDQSGVSVLGLRFKQRNEQVLGFYFMALELTIGTLGEALNINAFDQPGVELGKKIARSLLLALK